MTTEIAIINSHAIALAADSASTVGGKKVWKSAEKLFSLSPGNDIGIMIYNNANFGTTPWETIIKTFRQQHSNLKFLSVEECSSCFQDYLNSDAISQTFPEEMTVYISLSAALADILREVNTNNQTEFRAKFRELLEKRTQHLWRSAVLDFRMTKKTFANTHQSLINEALKHSLEITPVKITAALEKMTLDLAYNLLSKRNQTTMATGVVLAGFGKDELFPSIVTLTVDGRIAGQVRCWPDSNKCHDLNGTMDPASAVIPFAQGDVVKTFMQGFNDSVLFQLIGRIGRALDSRTQHILKETKQESKYPSLEKENNAIIMSEVRDFMSEVVNPKMITPILTVVDNLPKEDMAHMAENLIEMTSLRRKMDSTLESVGGPTDVAIISKGDGFIWKKRKHYFDSEMNKDFHIRRNYTGETQ